MAVILDGKKVAAGIKQRVAREVAEMDPPPRLAIIVVGDKAASVRYVRNKAKDCDEVGIL